VLAGFLANFLYARKFRTVISSLAANTATTITHGLNLANMEDMHCLCYQGGQQVELAIAPTTTNALMVTSNQALGNVTVVVQG
jgi:ABC-type arginine transport system ATPase subunit